MTTTEGLQAGPQRGFGPHVHVVFVTKYRRGVLHAEHLDLLEDVFTTICSDFGATLLEGNGEVEAQRRPAQTALTYPALNGPACARKLSVR